ncbi:MAG: glutamate--tRNA ligase, partial [Alphaproteobacteria bacterium]|nr:glutamate--tRNA ligase [Alphaproteobacteria bacterium]
LAAVLAPIEALDDWSAAAIEATVRNFIKSEGLNLGQVAQPLRAALTGQTASPAIFDVMAILPKQEALGRIRDAIGRS